MIDNYDEVPYIGYPHSQTHPDRLATVARLYGVNAAPVERCRVLELGCGDGANLIPMAFGLPGSEFVGVDPAQVPIAKGNALIESLGLRNISLRPSDVMEIGPELGEFDYIIAYGLYSWVPPSVQEKVLAISNANLAPNGVAYINYNAYPGSHIRSMLRDMMLLHVRGLDVPAERIAQARALLEFLSKSTLGSDPYRDLLQKELARLAELEDGSLYHDDLAEVNLPVYFHEFMERAASHGLQYLAEADPLEMQDRMFGAEALEKLNVMAGDDIVLQEQYRDFLKCRKFRQTLLCHQRVEVDRVPGPQRVKDLYVSSPARASSPKPDVTTSAVEEFHGPKGTKITISHPAAKAVLVELGAVWPQSIHFANLTDHGSAPLDEVLLNLYGVNFVELHVHNPPLAQKPGTRPQTSPLARRQAQDGWTVTNLRHQLIRIEDQPARNLLMLLDGTRDRSELLALLDVPAAALESNLEKMLRLALLERIAE